MKPRPKGLGQFLGNLILVGAISSSSLLFLWRPHLVVRCMTDYKGAWLSIWSSTQPGSDFHCYALQVCEAESVERARCLNSLCSVIAESTPELTAAQYYSGKLLSLTESSCQGSKIWVPVLSATEHLHRLANAVFVSCIYVMVLQR